MAACLSWRLTQQRRIGPQLARRLVLDRFAAAAPLPPKAAPALSGSGATADGAATAGRTRPFVPSHIPPPPTNNGRLW